MNAIRFATALALGLTLGFGPALAAGDAAPKPATATSHGKKRTATRKPQAGPSTMPSSTNVPSTDFSKVEIPDDGTADGSPFNRGGMHPTMNGASPGMAVGF